MSCLLLDDRDIAAFLIVAKHLRSGESMTLGEG